MAENSKDILYLLIALPFLALFSHVVAVIALSPVLYFWFSPGRSTLQWLALLLGTPALWLLLYFFSIVGGQYFQSPSTIGILIGAVVSTLIMFMLFGKNWFDENKWLPWLLILGLPSIGYFVGASFRTSGAL